MRRNKIRELMTISGDYMRVSQVPIRRTGSHKRGKRFAPTSAAQKKINQRNSEYRLTELLQTNFPRGSGARIIGADYDQKHKPCDCDTGIAIFRRYIRRINAECRKRGFKPAKYIYVTAYGEVSGRVHHHCVITCGLSNNELRRLWGQGRLHVNAAYYDESGLVGLADYLARQNSSTKRRWNSSKGLIHPETNRNDDAITITQARYIAANPYDYRYIEKLYPGWRVYDVITAAEPQSGGTLAGIYNTILFYKDGFTAGYDDE